MAEVEDRRPVLSVRDLVTEIGGRAVVDRVSLDVMPGEVVALVGESGSGKSLTALSIMGLLPGAARATGGEVLLDGEDLLGKSERQMRAIRGERLSMIFQEPVASLNPLVPVGDQVAESLIVHGHASRGDASRQAVEMLAHVGIPQPDQRARQLPAELSGGMCQRVMIASALISNPRLLIADEPTTALDVTIQAQILRLMKALRQERDTAILIITHDMGVVADIADRVCVMYGGRIVETAPVFELFERPSHPYTKLLLQTIPRMTGARKEELKAIEGTVPDVSQWPSGCRFRTRCPLAREDCAEMPPLIPVTEGHRSACWHMDELERIG
ncbi:ABC transporter ATP-binding protein [Lutibaculum baratangense]|uniref:Oligopeptide transport ATP-binding protein OppD n=1 Tax=Lutibaculum baratangense AMV1 TaxID=631454 RepID=V4RC74_9HYPH|nr:ABC transporter ATP-binding protein [Lutibaculum baratangense]ESR23771.1 Oligopeptide transport ATP-binding protein OppD [Lutibaculum baratangense AMV1]